MSLIDGIRTKFNVGGVNPFTPSRIASVSAGGSEATSGSAKKGWEAYHNGENPNGLNGGFLSDGTGEGGAHKLNMYM